MKPLPSEEELTTRLVARHPGRIPCSGVAGKRQEKPWQRLHARSGLPSVRKARERLAAAEQEAGTTAATAAQQLPVADLAKLAGVPAAELRRLIRASRAEQSSSANSSANGQQPAAHPGVPDALAQPEPAPATG